MKKRILPFALAMMMLFLSLTCNVEMKAAETNSVAAENLVNDNASYYEKAQNALFDTPVKLNFDETHLVTFRPKTETKENGSVTYPSGSIAQIYSLSTTNENNFYNIYIGNVSCDTLQYYIFDEYGALLDDDLQSSGRIYISKAVNLKIKLNPNSTYYIIVYCNNSQALESLSQARINVSRINDDAGDTFEKSNNVQVNQSYSLELNGYKDYDYVKFTTKNTPAFYNFYVNNINVERELDVKIFNDKKEEIGDFSLESNLGKYEMLYLDENSTYYAVFYSENGNISQNQTIGKYSFKINVIDDDYSGNDIYAKEISYHKTYNGKLDADNDVDVVKFNSYKNIIFALRITNSSSERMNIEVTDFNGNKVFTETVSAGFSGDIIIQKNNAFKENSIYYLKFSGKANKGYTFSLSQVEYKIDYFLNGGVNNPSNPVSFIANYVQTFKKPTREGYTFEGWYLDKNFYESSQIYNTSELFSNTSVYAKWSANTCKITYKLNGGKNHSSNPKTFVVDSSVKLKNPTKKGYVFKGWYTNSKFSGKKITNTSTLKKKTTLYAKWSKVTSKTTSISKLTKKNKSFLVKWKKISGVKGYEIRYSTKSSMKKSKTVAVKAGKNSYTVKKLKKKTKYYVQIRTYKLDSCGKKVYSKWSSKKTVKTK